MLPESSSDRRGTLSSEVGEGPGYRTSSIVSRHFSVATKVSIIKMLSDHYETTWYGLLHVFTFCYAG